MPLSSLWLLYRRRLRARLAQEAFAVAGIAAGVALVFAALVATASLTGSLQQLTNGIVGDATLVAVARSPAGLDQHVIARIDRLDGVERAARLLEARAKIVGPDGETSVTLVGGDPGFATIGGPLVRQFSASELARQRAVALPAPMAGRLGLRLYSQTTIQTGAGTSRLPLGARLSETEIGSLIRSPIAIMPLAAAQQVTGMPGRISRIYVQTGAGEADRVRAALEQVLGDRANVRAADFDADLFASASSATNQSTLMFAALAALVGFLFAISAVWLTVAQRRAVVTLLRRSGYPRRQVALLMLLDAVALGLVGSAIGLLLGDQLSRHIDGGVPGFLTAGWPIGSQRIVPWYAIVGATAAGIAAACIAILIAMRTGDTKGAMSSAAERTRSGEVAPVLGGLGILVATVIAATAPTLAPVGLAALLLALLLLLPSLLRAATFVLAWATGPLNPAALGRLPVMELRSRSTAARTIALTATGAIAVFAVIAINGARSDLVRGLEGSGRAVDDNADVWVTSGDTTSTFAVTPFTVSRASLADLRRLPAIASVGVYRGGFADLGNRRVWVQAPPADAPAPVPPGQLLEGDLADATRRVRAGGAVVLSKSIADAEGVGVGDSITLPSAYPTPMRVAAISNNLGWPSGAIVMNADDYARQWAAGMPSALQVHARAGADPSTVAAAVRRTLDPDVAVSVETRDERLALHREATEQGLIRLRQIAALVLVTAMFTMAAATAAAIWQRRQTIARYRAHGYSVRMLWASILIESAVVLTIGCVAGAAAGLLGQRLLASALESITGFPVLYSTAGVMAAAVVAVVAVSSLAIIAIPGWFAARVTPTARASS